MMRTKIYVLAIILSMFCIIAGFTQQMGDVNGNGSIDVVDALLCAQYYVGLPVSIYLGAGDVDCDKAVTIVDALMICQYYIGLISTFSCRASDPPTATPTVAPTPVPTAVPTGPPTPDPTAIPTAVPGEGRVWLYPSEQTVSTGNNFTTVIYVNSGKEGIAIRFYNLL
jgi:hypothetical protein